MMWIDVDTAVEVFVNALPLTDDTDFKSRETSIAYNAAGMDLVWNFQTPGGTVTQTAVTPTTSGDYDWTHVGDGMYKIEIPASGGASINNDTEGFGWFTGFVTGVLPWSSPVYGFRAAGLNGLLIEDAFSATRGLAGTALPAAAADAAGGLPISDAGGLDIDTLLGYLTGSVATAAALTALTTRLTGTVAAQGTIGGTGNDTTHLHLTSETYGDDEINNYLLVVYDDSAGEYHARYVEDWVNSTKLATVATLPFTPEDSTDTYWLLPFRQDVTGGSGLDAAGVRAAVGLASANLDTQLSPIPTIAGDVENLDGAAMRGTDDAALASTLGSLVTTVGSAGAGLTEAGGTGDHLSAVPDTSGTTTLLSRLSATRAGYLDNLSAGAVATASALSTAAGNITTILGKFTGITLLAEWLGALAGKQNADATALSEIRATGAGSGTFDPNTDALEGIRDTEPLGTAMRGTDSAYTGTPPTAGAIADAVWDEAAGDHTESGSFGEEVQAHALSSEIPSANDNADALLDRSAGVETNRTVRQSLRLILAACVAKLSGAGTTTVTIRDTNDSKDRITATVDEDGNRSAVTLDGDD